MPHDQEDLFDSARGSAARRKLILETDGGARGNPGPAGFGAVVRDGQTNEVLAQRADYLGEVTNNVAEYTGLLEGLKAAKEVDPEASIEVRADSKLVVEQMSGRWKIKHPDMQTLAMQARRVFPPERVRYTWVPRAQNKQADRLANEAMDTRARVEWNADESENSPAATGDRRTNHAVGPQPRERSAHVRHRPSGSRIRFDDEEPVTIVLVRHGETEMTEKRTYSGAARPGPPLSARGRTQASAAAELVALVGHKAFLDLFPVSKLLASPLARAMETASIVGERLGITVQEAPAFIEADFGGWEGLHPREIENGWPGELERWHRTPELVAPGGGESLSEVGERVARATAVLANDFAGRTVAVCAHVVAIRAAIGAALGVGPDAWGRVRVSPGGVSIIRIWPRGDGEVVSLNAVS